MKAFALLLTLVFSASAFGWQDPNKPLDIPTTASDFTAVANDISAVTSKSAAYYASQNVGGAIQAGQNYDACILTCTQKSSPSASCVADCSATYLTKANVEAANQDKQLDPNNAAPQKGQCFEVLPNSTQLGTTGCGNIYYQGTTSDSNTIGYDDSGEAVPTTLPPSSTGYTPQVVGVTSGP
jgi:hypothetical protein